ncbi:FecR domain-containing protein [Sphingobium sp. BHU LFT2]|uniref:FecR family protein n=1 Tax=Sphingobium sp. BHU LFT2 TaxID=2807634 RepID=UPI001BEBD08C|nr:FecR domain-containing protein [Sphingobium sp. BHU LFT2]MBT2246839.1 FecR domain-containing protein [Sphingobium sp. BHU LFT2]
MMEDTDPPRRHGQLREEAADWFAIMRNPEEAEVRRKEFDAWLARGALHRAAYNRIAETYSIGKRLKDPPEDDPLIPDQEAPGDDIRQSPPKPKTKMRALLILAMLGAVALVTHWASGSSRDELKHPSFATGTVPATSDRLSQKLATAVGEIRSFQLEDGSVVALDTNSLVLVDFDSQRRNLRLVRGRARFTVAHENRLFTVRAGRGAIIARGTIFDVNLSSDNRVFVRLVRGAVDVEVEGTKQGRSQKAVHLLPGQQVELGKENTVLPIEVTKTRADDAHWPEGMKEFTNIRLGDLFIEVNRYARIPLVAETSDIDELRVSGNFRITDSERLARNLGDLMGLAVVTRPSSISLARRCPSPAKGNCRPPS